MTLPTRRDRGFALLIVLWSLVLIAFLTTQVASTGRTEVRTATNLRRAAVLQARADGGVYEAAFHLLDRGDRHWDADGAWHPAAPGGVALRITDEAEKVNLNSASPDLLRALLGAVGADVPRATALAEAITDWRDDPAQGRPMAARVAPYRAAGLGDTPPGSPFGSVSELRRVIGVTPALYAALAPHVTVFSTHGPGGDTRDPIVLRALTATRDAGGVLPDMGAAEPVDVIAVQSVAAGADGDSANRNAVLRLDPKARDGVHVLDWR